MAETPNPHDRELPSNVRRQGGRRMSNTERMLIALGIDYRATRDDAGDPTYYIFCQHIERDESE